MQWFRKSNKLQNLAPTYLKGHSQKQNFCQRYQIFFWFLINLKCQFHKQNLKWGVVVVQLAEELLLIPEICRSNPVIGNFVHYQKLRKKRKEMVIKILSCTNPNQFLEYGANQAYFYYFVLYTLQTQGSRMAGANGSIQAWRTHPRPVSWLF